MKLALSMLETLQIRLLPAQISLIAEKRRTIGVSIFYKVETILPETESVTHGERLLSFP